MAALEHREPDRVPMDRGSARVTGIVKDAYEKLCAYLGFGKPGPVIDRMQQIVQVDERVLATIRSCTRAKIFYHTCESVYAYIPDFIEWGSTR